MPVMVMSTVSRVASTLAVDYDRQPQRHHHKAASSSPTFGKTKTSGSSPRSTIVQPRFIPDGVIPKNKMGVEDNMKDKEQVAKTTQQQQVVREGSHSAAAAAVPMVPMREGSHAAAAAPAPGDGPVPRRRNAVVLDAAQVADMLKALASSQDDDGEEMKKAGGEVNKDSESEEEDVA